jgi:hypothetical protein
MKTEDRRQQTAALPDRRQKTGRSGISFSFLLSSVWQRSDLLSLP